MRALLGVLRRRLWSSLVQASLSLIVVTNSLIHASARRWPTSDEDSCPVRLRSNVTMATCTCSSVSVNEIRCSGGLDQVPQFLPTDRVFHALHLSKQNINEIIQGSFTNLQVSFLPVIA